MMNVTKKAVKGFTIVEMIVVIAIITILLGVLAPSLMVTYRQSRINSANADAKMIYNAVQTEVIHYMARDRSTTSKSGFEGSMWITYDPGTGVKYTTQADVTDSASIDQVAAATDTASIIANAVNHSVSGAGEVHWAVYINNYIVKSSVASTSASSNCIGFYSANKAHADGYSSGNYSSTFVTILNNNKDSYNAKYPNKSEDKGQ